VKRADLMTVAKTLGPVVKEFVERAVTGLSARVDALERREAPVGKDGAAGPQGEPGARGEVGPQGEPGPAGATGATGPAGGSGPQGPPGPAGSPGEKGLDGVPGRDGRDGQPGVPGQTGEKGLDGKDGKAGRDGVDGLGFDDFDETFDGERTITRTYRSGDRVKVFKHRFPIPIERGVYQAGRAYEKDDIVTFGGSQWIAKRDTTDKPEEHGEDRAWRLCVKRGRDGKVGPEGKQGPEGPRGLQGPQGPRGF
jgi:integrin beta 3